jgi:hypothetical protein
MSNANLIESLFEEPTRAFNKHLLIEDNERIIFSGRFGIGKTTFLKKWFFTEAHKINDSPEPYNVFHLFPVNYSVAQNEDIFKYLKYDILLEMLRQGIRVEEIDLSYIQTLPFFAKENLFEIGATLLRMVPKVGKDLSENAGKVKELVGKYLKFHESRKKTANIAGEFLDYIQKIEQTEGSIYEEDIITQLIVQELKKLKDTPGPKKENILIIDDLDRIDPEHIFRILNVFAAHFDRPNAAMKNKFGFDKIVLVCDINNIRQIFKAKFGSGVDFNGYIDKFYSQRVFEFNPYKKLPDIAKNFLFHKLRSSDSHNNDDALLSHLGHGSILTQLIDHLILNQELDLRNIIKLEGAYINLVDSFIVHSTLTEKPRYTKIAWALKIACHIKGDYLGLIDALEKSSNWESWTAVGNGSLEQHCSNLLYILLIPEHKGGSQIPTFVINGVTYMLKPEPQSSVLMIMQVNAQTFTQTSIQPNNTELLKYLLVEVIKLLQSQHVFHN